MRVTFSIKDIRFLLKSPVAVRTCDVPPRRIGSIVSTRVARTQGRLMPIAPTHASPVTRIGPLGKPVGAVSASADELRALHAASRPLNASEVARAASLHRGTAYN